MFNNGASLRLFYVCFELWLGISKATWVVLVRETRSACCLNAMEKFSLSNRESMNNMIQLTLCSGCRRRVSQMSQNVPRVSKFEVPVTSNSCGMTVWKGVAKSLFQCPGREQTFPYEGRHRGAVYRDPPLLATYVRIWCQAFEKLHGCV